MQGSHYHRLELEAIKSAIVASRGNGTPLTEVLDTLAGELHRTAKAIRKTAVNKGYLDVERRAGRRHTAGVTDDEAINTAGEAALRVATRAADEAFKDRMCHAILKGSEKPHVGVVKRPCTHAPRRITAEPLIYIRSSSDFVGVESGDSDGKNYM